jgi:hypothetical protein
MGSRLDVGWHAFAAPKELEANQQRDEAEKQRDEVRAFNEKLLGFILDNFFLWPADAKRGRFVHQES